MATERWTPELSRAAAAYLNSSDHGQLAVDKALAERRTIQRAPTFSRLPKALQDKVRKHL